MSNRTPFPAMPPSPRPKPSKKFSFRNLKARFASQSEEPPRVTYAEDLSKLYPTKSPTENQEWDPSQLVDGGYPTPSPSASSRTSFRGDKHLPPVPAFQPSQTSPAIQAHEPQEESSELPWVSLQEDVAPVEDVHRRETKSKAVSSALAVVEHRDLGADPIGTTYNDYSISVSRSLLAYHH